jgi:poly-gamma-glutamate capsule biosynthesis protein CapA/YwtB (metallophosphatase superfamily)
VPARIAFLGDTLLGDAARPVLGEQGYGYALDGIRHLWADADLVVANIECALTTRSQRAPKPDRSQQTGRNRTWYRADPASAHTLADQGIGVASLANNHVSDFGPSGVLDTMAALDAAGIAHCGAGRTDTAARRPVTVPVNGLRVGFLSAMQRYEMYLAEEVYARRGNPGPARLRMSRLAPDIAALRAEVDLCVVLVHWGRNYRPVTARQRRLARDIVAAGADVVVGHHPHIAQPVVAVDGVPVLYSLGNAAFGTLSRHFPVQPPYGLVAVVDAEAHRVAGLDLRLIEVDNRVVGFQPRPAEGPAASAFLSSLYTPVFPPCGRRGRTDRSPGRVAGARRLDA